MRVARKRFVGSAIAGYAAIGVPRYAAGAAEFTYRWSLDWSADFPIAIRSVQAAQKILHESDGRLQIRVFTNSVLGSSVAQIEQTRIGAIEIVGSSLLILGTSVPITGLSGLPFVFSGHKEANDAMDGAFGKAIFAGITKTNLHPFEKAWGGPFRDFTNNVRPITAPADLDGVKMRIITSPVTTATFRALGASPVAIDGTQIYSACQTHIVDGTDLPLSYVLSIKLYEVQKYASVVKDSWTGYIMSANVDAWRKLPANLQDIASRNINAAALLSRQDLIRLDATIESKLRAQGMVLNTADTAPFIAKLRSAGLYAQWRSQYGADAFGLLEQSVGKLV
jgi:tripartite ATP-independent transporter DctP family solute receptor